MSSYERSTIRTRIEEHLDAGGVIRADVEAGFPRRQGLYTYAEETVAALDSAFADGGGAGVTVDEMVAYVEWLIETAQQEGRA